MTESKPHSMVLDTASACSLRKDMCMTCSRDIRFQLEFQNTGTVLITATDQSSGAGQEDFIESEVLIADVLPTMLEMRKTIEGWT
ncbi:MAG: hypothetical protein K2W95_15545 [Candidatus Obscuribacterales bacterium]|nr:hypothetical protein [Candidatus Obscuribacterales bacterium]